VTVVSDLGKLLIVGGVVLIVAGVVLQFVGRLPGGMLPGDIYIQRKGWSFSFPVVTCLVISVVLTLIVNLFFRR
jgi:hypothetical protein